MNKLFLTACISLCVGMYFGAFLERHKITNDKHIDLPEEWSLAKQGDTLKIYKVNADTIFIGFYNSDNRNDRIYLKK